MSKAMKIRVNHLKGAFEWAHNSFKCIVWTIPVKQKKTEIVKKYHISNPDKIKISGHNLTYEGTLVYHELNYTSTLKKSLKS